MPPQSTHVITSGTSTATEGTGPRRSWCSEAAAVGGDASFGSVRVIAGTVGGRQLATVVGSDVRPTSDRVREALFNRLESRGLVRGASVLDLFAGSGALGIEALSRGAVEVAFVDRDRRSVEVVRANLDRLGLADMATVSHGDAIAFLDTVDREWGIALVDPPYDFDRWVELLDRLRAGTAVLESGRPAAAHPRWTKVHEKRYGRTYVTLVEPAGAPEPGWLPQQYGG